MAKPEATRKSGGVSFEPEDAMGGVGLGPGKFKIKEAYWGMHDYGGTRKGVPALVWIVSRNGEKQEPAFWTAGQGWRIKGDGQVLEAKAGQTGLPSNCNAMHLIRSLREAGMPKGYFQAPEDLVGVTGTLISKPLPKFLDKKSGKEKEGMSVLVVDEVTAGPWDEESEDGDDKKTGKGKKTKKPADDDDEEDEDQDDDKDDDDDDDKDDDDDDDDEDADDDDEEDEDEKPKGRGKGKAAAGKKKAKPADDDEEGEEDEDEEESGDDDEDEEEASDVDEDQLELGVEALMTALEDGPLVVKKVAAAVAGQLKGNKQAKAVAVLMARPDVLKKQTGWKFDGKTVKLKK